MKFPILEQFGIRVSGFGLSPENGERVPLVRADQVERALEALFASESPAKPASEISSGKLMALAVRKLESLPDFERAGNAHREPGLAWMHGFCAGYREHHQLTLTTDNSSMKCRECGNISMRSNVLELYDRIAELEQENARLREALTSISNIENTEWVDRIFVAKEIAKRAINNTEKTKE